MVATFAAGVKQQIAVDLGPTAEPVVEVDASAWAVEKGVVAQRRGARLGLKVRAALLLECAELVHECAAWSCARWAHARVICTGAATCSPIALATSPTLVSTPRRSSARIACCTRRSASTCAVNEFSLVDLDAQWEWAQDKERLEGAVKMLKLQVNN